jgi:hypothetical protein
MREKTIIVGARHMGPAVQQACKELTEGCPLIVVREPKNPHDGNAIKLVDLFGRPVGYVQRNVAAQVAPVMDRGFTVLARCIRACQPQVIRGVLYLSYPRAVLWSEPPSQEQIVVPAEIDCSKHTYRKIREEA